MDRSPLRSSERCSRRYSSRNHLRQGRDRLRTRRLFLERLEDRSLLATMVWDGGGADNKWTTAANWVGDVAPQQDDNLVFQFGGVQHTNVNDYANGTRFRSVTVSAANYSISQDTGTHGITLLEGFVYNGTGTGATFDVPITLGAAQTFYSANSGASITLGDLTIANLQTLTYDGRGNMNIGGSVDGTGPIAKSGDGILTLSGDNAPTPATAYQGIITVTQGIVCAASDNALALPPRAP